MLQVFNRFQKLGTCWRIGNFSYTLCQDRLLENTQSNIVLGLIQLNRLKRSHNSSQNAERQFAASFILNSIPCQHLNRGEN